MKTEYIYKHHSPIGMLTVSSDGENITGLWIKNMRYGENVEIIEVNADDLSVFEKTRKWLDCYFDGKGPDFMPPVKTEGTEFRQSVWKILCEIPYGKVITYGDIAKKIALQKGKTKMSAQAVGGAVGSNPISILIPCHRVVGAKGNLTGYGGGLDIKVHLLQLEGMDMSKFHMPSK
ncbi:methylated-DNA--[protein]-cysteine S-methyltransferase [Petroclostridium sp. X23]|uniref:methylated-DNA--[protein]-cysteine S-methyltransferase n=1 Tax=Petroclostridium sp. X23 TaxID=3045146 RepID=UPI0024AD34D1|nr:methylated-DNA--[protein]-cysteine S-methyltransferase [Petroclostridium sp. X23]WHH60945.1 methylated-DNA--[protein]-cysteine S-methyltransferase [Petroclostridium sp. X23]